ncbi:MAG: hypothetical protein IT361_17090 [Gemmatimonadaceae bacterium]|nr:hypothetical protein [Gemmatimonadaceae bacterium]
MRGLRAACLASALVATAPACLTSAALGAQQRIVRFEITSVSDTSLTFRTGSETWVKRDLTGSAVDPRRRDQLVARFRVVVVADGRATALVTGQTTAVSTDHVAILEAPRRPWYRATPFWAGLLLGGAIGGASAVLAK